MRPGRHSIDHMCNDTTLLLLPEGAVDAMQAQAGRSGVLLVRIASSWQQPSTYLLITLKYSLFSLYMK